MQETLVFLERRYRLNISEDFHCRFWLLPEKRPSGERIGAGVYYYEIKVEERRGKDTEYVWVSKVLDNNGVVLRSSVSKYSLPLYTRRLAFVAEIINYAHDYDFCYWNENYFDLRDRHINYFSVRNFEIGDTFEDADFEIEMEFGDDGSTLCKKTFEKKGIDTNRYKNFYLYRWVISKTSAKLYYDRECIYTHPNPMLLLAYLGWYITTIAR